MLYNIRYDSVGMIILAILLIINRLNFQFPTRENSVYVHFVIISILALAFNIGCAIATSFLPPSLVWLNTLLAVIHIQLTNFVTLFYLAFVLTLTHPDTEIPKGFKKFTIILALFEFAFITSSPLLHTVMYFDKEGIYHHGWGMKLLYVITVAILILSLVELYLHRKNISLKQLFITLSYTVTILVTIIIQNIFPNLLIIGLATSLAELLIYFTLRNTDDFCIKDMGTYNRAAFKEFLYYKNSQESHSALVMLYGSNMDTIKNFYGTESTHYMLKQYVKNAQKFTGKQYYFYLFHNTLVIPFRNKNEAQTKLRQLMDYPINSVRTSPKSNTSIQFPITFKSFVLDDISIIQKISTDDEENPYTKLMSLLKFVQTSDASSNKINSIEPSDVYKLNHKLYVQEAVLKSIQQKSFEVFLQPIYDVKKKAFTTAESLIRMRDSDGNYIPPSLYIPEAEKNDMILIIGDFAIEKTCEFINASKCQELGIEKININLSMQQCMQEDCVEHILKILNRYEVPKNMIRFEITESLLESDSERLMFVMKSLIAEGIDFALDDFGTGYSNTNRLLNFPFSEVKFDKSFVDSIVKDEKKSIPLKHLIQMVKDLDKLVLVEGVESEYMAKQLEEYGAELIQGYCFAKPMPVEEFVAFLK